MVWFVRQIMAEFATLNNARALLTMAEEARLELASLLRRQISNLLDYQLSYPSDIDSGASQNIVAVHNGIKP